LRSTNSSSRIAITRPATSPIDGAAGGGAVDRLARHRGLDAGSPEPGGRVEEPVGRGAVELAGALVVVDRRVGGPPVAGEPARCRKRVLDGDHVRLAIDRGERGRDGVSRAGSLQVPAGGEDERRLGPGLRREAVLQQVLCLLGLDGRDGEVVLERAAGGDRATDQGHQGEQDGEGHGAGAATGERSEAGERGGHATTVA